MQTLQTVAEPLSARAVPLPCVDLDPLGHDIDVVDVGWCEYRFSGNTARRMTGILRLCDGDRSIDDLASSLDAPPPSMAKAVTDLYTRGIVRDVNQEPAPASTFQEHMVSVGRTLRTTMSREADLLGGELHRRRLLGTLVETFHFVSSASSHIGAAVAHAADRQVRDALAQLFTEEWKHGRDLGAGLRAAGLSDATVRRCQPLPGTRSVVNFLVTLAGTDLLSYAICAAVNESPKSDTAIKEGWDALIALSLVPAAALTPFRGHELEDEEADHASIAAAVFADRATISPDEQRRIRHNLESFVAVQRTCYREMKEFYAAPEGPVAWGV